jgi:multicomponent Na+:H+ antiporter subunit E
VNIFVLNLLLSLAWVGLTGEFTPLNFVIGFALGYFMLWLTLRTDPSVAYFKKVPQIFRFLVFFSWEVLQSNLRVLYEVLTPGHKMMPGIIAIPLDAKTDLEITILANLITLTPGTLSLDTSKDRSTLYIHAMYIDDVDMFKQKLKNGLEKRLLEVLR